MGYRFRQFEIPDYMMGGLERYIEHGIEPGDFLRAVICNDLRGAVERADDLNIAALPAYVAWLYNEAPCGSWGSKNNFEAWLKSFHVKES